MLQVQALGLAFLLRAQHSFASSSEVSHLDSHSALTEGHKTGLRADSLDVGTRKIILLGNELLQVNILVERHLAGVKGENLALSVLVGILKENLAINTARADQSRVERLNLVGGHDDLDVSTVVETIELVQELQHGSLDFTLTTRCRVVTLGTDGIDFVDKHDGRSILGSNLSNMLENVVEHITGNLDIPGKAGGRVEDRHQDTSG